MLWVMKRFLAIGWKQVKGEPFLIAKGCHQDFFKVFFEKIIYWFKSKANQIYIYILNIICEFYTLPKKQKQM